MTRIRRLAERSQVDIIVITRQANMAYLTGFEEGLALVVDARTLESILYVRRLDYERARAYAPRGVDVVGYSSYEVGGPRGGIVVAKSLADVVVKKCRDLVVGVDEVGTELYMRLKEGAKSVVDISNIVYELREVKDEEEVSKIEKALEITEEALEELRAFLRDGVRESELAAMLLYHIVGRRGQWISFQPIVASGENSSMPHYRFGDRRLSKGDVVVVDVGAKYEGYCSDITRTFFIGSPSEKLKDMYVAVLEASKRALKEVRPGARASEVDRVAREALAEYGYAEYFIHGLGHGVGVEIHERPFLNPASSDVLRPGMVITIEPGAYVGGLGGVRVEDMVLVTDTGARTLTKFEKLML